MPAVLAAAALADEARAVVPAGWTVAATRAAESFGIAGRGAAAGVSADVIKLAEQGIRAMTTAKLKLGLVLCFAVGTLAAGGAAMLPGGQAEQAPEPVKPPAAAVERQAEPLPAGARLRLGSLQMRHESLLAVTFLPNSRQLATAGGEGTIRIWNPDDGTETRQQYSTTADNLAVSRDGTILATAQRGTVKLWHTPTGKELRTIVGTVDRMDDSPAPLAFAPNGALLAVVGDGAVVRVVDVATGADRHRFSTEEKGTRCLAFTADGKRLVAVKGQLGGVANSYYVRVWDLPTGTIVSKSELKAEADARLRPLALSPDGATLAVEHAATARLVNPGAGVTVFTLYRLSLWDVATETWTLRTAGERDVLWAAAFSPDGKRVATAGMAQHVSVWNAVNGQLIRKLASQPGGSRIGGLSTLAFSPDGERIASVGDAATVHVWDVNTGQQVGPRGEGHDGAVYAVAYAPDGRTIATGSGDYTVRLWDAATGRSGHVLRGATGQVRSLAFSPNGRTVASAYMHSAIRLWDVSTGQLRQTIQAVPRTAGVYDGVCPMQFTSDGTRLHYWGDDRRFRQFDVASGQVVASRTAELSGLPPVPEGRPQEFNPAVEGITDVRFSPDGKTAAVSMTQSVRILDVSTGKESVKLPGELIRCRLAYSPDGRTLAAGGWDKSVVVWDTASDREVARVKDVGWIDAVAFASDGRMIAAATHGEGAAIHFIDARTGARLGQFRGPGSFVNSLAFSPDGRSLVAGLRDTTALVWDLPPLTPPAR